MDAQFPISLAFIWPLRLEYLTGWQALLLFAVLCVPIVLLGLRSLAGLGPVRRWVAMGMRILVILLLVLIVGGARWQKENKIVEVMVLRDISESTSNVHDYPDSTLQASIEKYLQHVSDTDHKQADDRIGLISFHSSAVIDAIPNNTLALDARAIRDQGHGTDPATAIQLGLATLDKDAMHRMLLISDGNATMGDLDAALAAAAAQHVPIDVMPLDYDVKNEVMVERFVAPTWKRENEPFTIDVYLRSTNQKPVTGKLTVLHNNQPMDLDPATAGVQPTREVTLQPGVNVERVTVPALLGSDVIHQFHATFEAPNVTAEVGNKAHGSAVGLSAVDTLTQNNSADAFTFVKGKGKVLYIDNVAEGRGQLLRTALANQGITLDDQRSGVDQFPNSMTDLLNYDAVILANVPRGAGGLSEDEQKMLASYVHDMGGGLVMIGGDQAFGAGGWEGSKLEEVLPVNMDIPAQRQIPKGALVLIMHSCEMPDGNYWGEQCAIKAIETLSAQDEIGVISFQGAWQSGSGSQWDFLLDKKGDGSKVVAAVKNMKLGDMPSFDDSMNVALNGLNGGYCLAKSDAKQKHVIIISDGDPQKPQQGLVNQYIQAKVSVSTVAVYPHPGQPPNMDDIAKELKGRAYGPINGNFSQLPQIFIKEATVVRRSLITEDAKGIPVKLNQSSTSEMVKGLTEVPDIFGMVLTSRKENPQIEMPLVAGRNSDPLLAHWQTGLGKAAVWTSDAHNLWAANWVHSGDYEKFWAQVVRSVSRPPMSADFDVRTTQAGDKGKITVEALNKDNAFLNFQSVSGMVVGPDLKPINVRLVQTGPGTYEGEFGAPDPGNYVAVLHSQGPNNTGGVMLSGMAVNSSPELRDLKSNDAVLADIARRTGGRVLKPFDPESADLFNREGLLRTASPLPIWDTLIPILLAMLILDVAVRRIAWDWLATKRAANGAADYVRSFTTVRKVESKQTLDALRKVRETTTADPAKPPTPSAGTGEVPLPDKTKKFEAKGVEGDISQIVGGASDKPIPSAPKKIEPKGSQPDTGAGRMDSLLEAKRRAQQQIKKKEDEQK